ncbi:MAG TPA: hypothetical protein PK264_02865 [Hyphomicrobiaceae bacterium]|nr:hypothetical protein [Hyphomicrobiaceae bacterium]
MNLVLPQIEHLILRARSDALGLGLPAPRFPFTASMVAAVHIHKDGIGDGVWFRLHDGRVFNCFAEEQDCRLTLYDDGALQRRMSAS